MDLNPTLALAPQVAEAALTLEALLTDGGSDLAVMRARKELRVKAADLKAACEAHQGFQPWTPHNQGNTK